MRRRCAKFARRGADSSDRRWRRLSGAVGECHDRSPVDLLWGIGGTPEGVISAAALRVNGRGGFSVDSGRATQTSGRRRLMQAMTSSRSAQRGFDLCSGEVRLLLRPLGSPMVTCCRACATAATAGLNEIAGDALRARARCAASRPATIAPSCARSPASATADSIWGRD